MSKSRSARRTSYPAAVAASSGQIDRTFLISFLEIEPEVAAALGGESVEIARAITATHESAAEAAARVNQVVEPQAHKYKFLPEEDEEVVYSRPRVIDVEAQVQPSRPTLHRINVDELPPRKKTRKPKVTREAKKAQRRTGRVRRSEVPGAHEQIAAAVAGDGVPSSSTGLQVAAIQGESTSREISTRLDTVAHHSNPMGVALERAAEMNLPFTVPDFSKMIVQIRNGMRPPALAGLSWDYMNFQMPPRTDLNLTPRQAKREEWKSMKTYFRIHPYKSHYKQDQRSAKRLISQAKRAGLDLA